MSKFKFSKRSLDRLKGVHPNLVKVMYRALEISEVDFLVTEGVRSEETQRRYVREGKSQTMNSKHRLQQDGFSHAVDLAPYPVVWDLEAFYPIAEAVQKSANELNVRIRWGGAWAVLNNNAKPKELLEQYGRARRAAGRRPFYDAPHFELY